MTADFIEHKTMRGNGDRGPWVAETWAAMQAKGATYGRLSHPIDDPDNMWMEGWLAMPADQGPHPWETATTDGGDGP